MYRRQFFGFLAAALAVPVAVAFAQPRPEERHEGPCERLDQEERQLRDRLAHERDPRQRDQIERRLHEIDKQRGRDCPRR